jgi:hypothetical protein
MLHHVKPILDRTRPNVIAGVFWLAALHSLGQCDHLEVVVLTCKGVYFTLAFEC